MHHKQYITLTQRYKDASHIVDDMELTPFPTKTEIEGLTHVNSVVSGLTRVRKHLEAVRTEKKGRELQHSRFFKKSKRQRHYSFFKYKIHYIIRS